MKPAIVTLTTDFGTRGSYVAAMKGTILGIAPDVRLVDVSHEIAPQNVREAALCLWEVFRHFPPATIHVVVVDPGVGGARRLLCVEMHGQVFLAPDNGVLSWVAREAPAVNRFVLAEPRFWRPTVSTTFHGRDILAPVAANLSRGACPAELGPATPDWTTFPWPAVVRTADELCGEVLSVDRFGNLITNIAAADLPPNPSPTARVICAGTAAPLARTYCDAASGALVSLIGSSGLLEIAMRDGSAVSQLRCAAGERVVVSR